MAAVLEAVERDLVERLAGIAARAGDPLSAIGDGAQWYLDECVRSTELQRAGLLEGRRELGVEKWRETVAPYGLTILAQALAEAMQRGQIVRADPTALAHLILALHEASALIMSAPDRESERARTGRAVGALIDGLGGGAGVGKPRRKGPRAS